MGELDIDTVLQRTANWGPTCTPSSSTCRFPSRLAKRNLTERAAALGIDVH